MIEKNKQSYFNTTNNRVLKTPCRSKIGLAILLLHREEYGLESTESNEILVHINNVFIHVSLTFLSYHYIHIRKKLTKRNDRITTLKCF